jgi:hypothetical protein
MTGPDDFPYRHIVNGAGGRGGLLTGDVGFLTPIIGHNVKFRQTVYRKKWFKTYQLWVDCTLSDKGALVAKMDTHWDYGTGALDTPDVVRASLAHDMLCHLTDFGLIPWDCRALADMYYRQLLAQYGCPWWRRWCHWAVVRIYSKTGAYWRRTK